MMNKQNIRLVKIKNKERKDYWDEKNKKVKKNLIQSKIDDKSGKTDTKNLADTSKSNPSDNNQPKKPMNADHDNADNIKNDNYDDTIDID